MICHLDFNVSSNNENSIPHGIYLFKVNKENTKTIKKAIGFTIKALGIFTVKYEHISHIAIMFKLFTWNK